MVVALYCTNGMGDFLANALIGMSRVGIAGSQIVVGCPADAEPMVRRIAAEEPVAIRILDDAPAPEYLNYGSAGFVDAMWLKIRLIRELLEVHDHVVYADLDVSWLRNPLPYLEQVARQYPMAFQTEAQARFPPAVCGGFMSFRRDPRTLEFLGAMVAADAARVLSEARVGDQEVAQALLEADGSWLSDIFFLPETLFVNGLGHRLLIDSAERSVPLTGTLQPFVFHANWTIGTQRKRDLMQTTSTWFAASPVEAAEGEPEITIVYPVFDVRGDEVERIRLWTQEQDAPDDCFRVIVVTAPGTDAGRIQRLLRPQDQVLVAPAAGREADYWRTGVLASSSRWVLFVEGHAIPDRDCLSSVLTWIDNHPEDSAVNCEVRNPPEHPLAPLMTRFFTEIQASWADSDTWPRLHRAAFAIRRDALDELGPMAAQYGQFVPPLISALLHDSGRIVATAEGAVVEHEDSLMDGHHADTRDYVRGEMDARADLPADFFESYFGPSPLGTLRVLPARTAREGLFDVWRASASSPSGSRRSLRHSRTLIPRAFIGMDQRIAVSRRITLAEEWLVTSGHLPMRIRWRIFTKAHRRVVRTEQLTWVSEREPELLVVGTGATYWRVDHVPQGALVGVHAVEHFEGVPFRWTEPLLFIRVEGPALPWRLLLETRALGGSLSARDVDVIVDGSRLPLEAVSVDEGGTISVNLPAATSGPRLITVIVDSKREKVTGGGGRSLGLPLFGIQTLATVDEDVAAATLH